MCFARPHVHDTDFDSGKIGTKYEGYPSVGCGAPWYGAVGDARARFFSLPGRCSDKVWADKDEACMAADPGGECPPGRSPSGETGCTWRAEPLGHVTLNQMVDIDDEEAWCRRWGASGREYVGTHGDGGVGTCFWARRASPAASDERAAKVLALFERKYPGTSDRPVPEWAC